jgi:isoaspartyl peptidase/L-asparaginase-like protein (Ntn-hydrolase superfamily)
MIGDALYDRTFSQGDRIFDCVELTALDEQGNLAGASKAGGPLPSSSTCPGWATPMADVYAF